MLERLVLPTASWGLTLFKQPDNPMTQIEYPHIEPLIADQQVAGTSVNITFRCPETSVEATASASVKKDAGIAADAGRKVKKGLWNSLRRSVTSAITDALGRGTAGRVARDVASSAMAQQANKTAFSKAEIQAAAVSAFGSVRGKFQWDAKASKWIGLKEPTTAFAKRLQVAPIEERYDRGVLARALVELSAADGSIGDEERAFLGQFLDPELGTIDDFASREPLKAGELTEVAEPVRASILMLAWATAMCDEDVADEEVARLSQLADGMQIDDALAKELRGEAQRFLFEQALSGVYEEGSRDASLFAEATVAAESMGMSTGEIEAFDANFRKRAGIV